MGVQAMTAGMNQTSRWRKLSRVFGDAKGLIYNTSDYQNDHQRDYDKERQHASVGDGQLTGYDDARPG